MLKELCLTPVSSGNCFPLIDKIKAYLVKNDKEKSLTYCFDKVGNFIVEKNSHLSNCATIVATLDEAGLLINSVFEDGRLGFDPVEIVPANIVGKQFIVGKQMLPAIVGFTPIHLQHRKNISCNTIKSDDLRITIGAKNKEEALAQVSLGDFALFPPYYKKVGTTIFASRLDNRGCVWVAIELLLSGITKIGLKVIFTQVSKAYPWGVSGMSSTIPSKINIVLQTVASDDYPLDCYEEDRNRKTERPTESVLGKGPVLFAMDKGHISDLSLFVALSRFAKDNAIPLQVKQSTLSSGEAALYARQGAGLPTITVGIPCRYQNCPISMMRTSDISNTALLLKGYLSK